MFTASTSVLGQAEVGHFVIGTLIAPTVAETARAALAVFFRGLSPALGRSLYCCADT